ncbi:MAG: helix-turn-helix transcriptional regulator [Synergistaceae bacterium]|nr:helix-turn-helix transcriptional regulator [Synergistaceae bacterium]
MPIQNEEDRIKLLQDNLRTIRLICGWTLDDFARRLGVTKQSISRFENKKVEITRAMYIAIRAVLEEKCSEEKNSGDNYGILTRAIPILLREGECEKLSDMEYGGIKTKLETLAAAYLGRASKRSVSYMLSNYIASIPALSGAALFLARGVGLDSGFAWLTKLLKSDDDKGNADEANEPV